MSRPAGSRAAKREPSRRRQIPRAPLRGHWAFVSVLLVALMTALLAHGLTHGELRADGYGSGWTAPAPASVRAAAPVLTVNGGQLRSSAPRPGTVALTFDDGPDPRWTPQVLDVLRQHGVHATFFVVGAAVAEHPDLVRRIRAEGHELGVHTFTHADLGTSPGWRADLEMAATQLVVAGATEEMTPLLRPPYAPAAADLDERSWKAIERSARDGYATVLSTLDSEDWRRPGVAEVVRRSTPTSEAGDILLMHDGGGDRAQTVEALRTLLPALRARGVQVGTVSEAVGAPLTTGSPSWSEQFRGRALSAAVRISDATVAVLAWMLVIGGVLSVVRAGILLLAGRRHVRRRRGHSWGAAVSAPVSIIVPAFDERLGIEATVRSLLASDHPVEVIVVDDGSTDGTADLLEALGLPGVTVVRQPNAGKPAALNTGLALARHDVVVMVDADTVLESDAVRHLVQPFADPDVGGVSGNAKVANRGGVLGRWQHIEYVMGFNLDRRFFDLAQCMLTVPGAIGAFRRSVLAQIEGISGSTLAEDTDLTMAVVRGGWRVVYEEGAVAWTEAPAGIRALWRQRYRWCYGTLQAAWKHRRAVGETGAAGRLGRRGLLYLLLFQVVLPLLAPVVDIFAVYGLLFLDPWRTLAVWSGFLAMQALLGWYAFRLDREDPKPLLTLPLQQLLYRQLMCLVVIQSVATALAGSRLRWQRIERYGSLDPSLQPAADSAAGHATR